MAEEWHKTPGEILDYVSVTDMYRWRLLKVARAQAIDRAQRDAASGRNSTGGSPLELDPADLIDGMYLPDAEPGS
jgi:hypothetical protein